MDDVILLADSNSKAWEFAKKIQDYIQQNKETFIPLKEVSVNYFRNGEINLNVPENVRKRDVYFIHDSSKNPQQWWVELLLLKDLLLSASAESVTFVLPNMLYSRQDRKDKPHVPISARALANSISTHGLKRVITMDLHAPQIQGFYNEDIPLDNLYSFPAVVKHLIKTSFDKEILKNIVVVSPDVGGVDRARAFAQRLGSNNPIAFIQKKRVKAGEISEMILVGEVIDKDILLIDDIIDSGGTLISAAKLLREEGAKKIWCYGTHGIFTKGTVELCKNFEKVMTSNTHSQERDGAEVIDVSPIFAEAIYRAQVGESISSLFSLENNNHPDKD